MATAAPSTVAGRSELISILGDVKARVQDKLGVVDFPMPQFILIGKQSVGKSRLTEAFAGETFNFISGTLGSRRPTVLEFRHVPSCRTSRWYVRDRMTNQWQAMHAAAVMKAVGDAHEELGEDTSPEPVYVRLESAHSVDLQIVDLPGFRDFAADASKQQLSEKIEALVTSFMRDRRNVMLCVEQAADAATMSTLARCREIDPRFERTILIRSKLDKYYNDLASENINKWVDGFGDLPGSLVRFALTLPWWQDGHPPPKPFAQLREEKNEEDLRVVKARGLNPKLFPTIGFASLQAYMEGKIERMFAESIGPVMGSLRGLQETTAQREQELQAEFCEDPHRILGTTRDCGASFAMALSHVMEGVLRLTESRMTLEAELRAFHAHHQALGSKHFSLLPCDDFRTIDEYIDYLRTDMQVGAFDVEVNGGAQFRRLMTEVEVFLRFSDITAEVSKRDVIQARGVSISSLTWRDVVVKILSNEAHVPLQRSVLYVAERISWFFDRQKDAVIEFMSSLAGSPVASIYSPLYPKHAKLITQNEMIKHLVFQTYDNACQRQLQQFVELFDNLLTSTFSNPWVFLKGASVGTSGGEGETDEMAVMPSFDDTKERVPKEIAGRSAVEAQLAKSLQGIPMNPQETDEAVDRVQMLVLKTYSFIRSQICDQVELFAEAFFKLPMLRRLEADMALIELSERDKAHYEARRERLSSEAAAYRVSLGEITECIQCLQSFKLKCETRGI